MNTGELIKEVEKIAKEKYDGHYTIFSFTTSYKGFFQTPPLDYFGEDYERLRETKGYSTLDDLLQSMISNPKNHESY